MRKILSIVIGMVFLFSMPLHAEIKKQKHYKSSQQKRIAEYRLFMKRQYSMCLLQVSIYQRESEKNLHTVDLSHLYKRLAIMRSEDCVLMKKRRKEFETNIQKKQDREKTVPKMTFDNIYLYKDTGRVAT